MSIILAIPSKGRMKDDAVSALSKAGLETEPSKDARAYRLKVKGRDDIEVALMSASEIARELAAGSIDLGVTGEDLVRESAANWESKMTIAARLGFGKADVVVAVPDHWHDVETMADLDDVAAHFRHRHGRRLRIATKYWRMTQGFFSQQHGIQVYQIVESLGATEGAPGGGAGGPHCGHHFDGRDADGEPAEGSVRRRDPEIAGVSGSEPDAKRRCRRFGARFAADRFRLSFPFRDPP